MLERGKPLHPLVLTVYPPVDSPEVITDVVLVLLTIGLAVWGYTRGVSVGVLVAVGFGLGALFGSRVGPQILAGGLHDPLAPAVALPCALLIGGVLAIGAERAGFELKRRFLRRRYTVDAIGGALLGTFLGAVMAWSVAVAAAQVDGLKGTVRDSEVISRLNSLLPPPGPLVNPDRTYSIPLVRGGEGLRAPGDEIKHAPAVEAAARSVVKIAISGCGGGGSGSGWIAANGFVVSNAHVVHDFQRFEVQVEGGGEPHLGTPVFYDVKNDISVLRVPGVEGVPALRTGPVAKKNELAAVLGFPYGKRYKARAARIGSTRVVPVFREAGKRVFRSLVTRLRSDVGPGPGSSGGPIVDRRGRVVAMTFAGEQTHQRRRQYAVPSSSIKRDLKRALASPKPVDTGDCIRE